jgi:hypothetical protein
MAERFKIVGFWSAPADPARTCEFERDYRIVEAELDPPSS